MLASPYISGFRADTENMYDKVREVDELLELWTNCQSKVSKPLPSYNPRSVSSAYHEAP